MSDNVYHVKSPAFPDVTQRNQIDFEEGVEDERDRLVNSLQEYIVTEVYGGQAMSQDNQDLLEAFVDWHLEGAE